MRLYYASVGQVVDSLMNYTQQSLEGCAPLGFDVRYLCGNV